MNVPAAVKVAVIDDHEAILLGMSAAFEKSAVPVTIVGTSTNIPDFLSSRTEADVVLLDLLLGDESDPKDNVETLIEAGYRVLVYSIADNVSLIRRALAGGAAGVCTKSEPVARTVESILALASGRSVLSQEVLAAIEGDTDYVVANLTGRERDVLALYAAGMELPRVAKKLGITQNSAKEYLRRIRVKYTVADRPASTKQDLLRRAIEDGIIPPPIPRR